MSSLSLVEPTNEEHDIQNGVKNFYNGRSVLITGVTGFLGGMTLEKLLRSCPNINKIYVLIRKKRGSNDDARVRLQKLLTSELFVHHTSSSLSKVIAISGDVSLPDLGLSELDRNKLINEVSVVFHVAANINFSVQLPYMIEVNLLGTRRILELCKSMKYIEAMVYVSTAYCNCILRDTVAEKVYPSSCDADYLIELLKNMKHEEIVSKTPVLLGGHPNTYTFTKLLAENLIASERGSIPIAIIRPSMVLGTLREPVVGWIDNVKTGIFALIAGSAKGVFRTMFAKPNVIADIVPGDKVTNIIVTSAWSIAKRTNDFRIFHMTSGLANPITWEEYTKLTVDSILNKPVSGAIWYPSVKCERMSSMRKIIHVWVFHYFQGIVVDTLAKLRGDKPILLDIQRKYFKGMEHTKYFVSRQWKFDTKNTDSLLNELSPIEREEFCFDVRSYKWPEYIADCLEGVKRFYFKEKSDEHTTAKKEIKMLKIVYFLSKLFFFIAVLTLFNLIFDDRYFIISFYFSAILTVIFIGL